MKKSFLVALPLISIVILELASCQKDNTYVNNTTGTNRPAAPLAIPNPAHANDTDTSQNAYTISVLNSPEAGQILLSPNLNSSHSSGLILITNQNGHVFN